MIKGLKYIGTINGTSMFEDYGVDFDIIDTDNKNYENLIVNSIRLKYTIDDELSLNSKLMNMYNNKCTEEEYTRWNSQINEFCEYRRECIENAKKICNIK